MSGGTEGEVVPGVELWGGGSKVTSEVMTPVAKSHIGSLQSEIDLEMQRGPALQRSIIQTLVHTADCRNSPGIHRQKNQPGNDDCPTLPSDAARKAVATVNSPRAHQLP